MLGLVTLGTVYMMASVGVTIHRRRHAIPTGAPVGEPVTDRELAECFDELQDVSVALRKYLERSHHLLGSYDSEATQRSEIQRWAEEGEVWRGQWLMLGRRCRLTPDGRLPRPRQEIEAMAAAYEEMGRIQNTYTDELRRFGKELAPRLERIRRRLDRIGDRLASSPSPPGEKE